MAEIPDTRSNADADPVTTDGDGDEEFDVDLNSDAYRSDEMNRQASMMYDEGVLKRLDASKEEDLRRLHEIYVTQAEKIDTLYMIVPIKNGEYHIRSNDRKLNGAIRYDVDFYTTNDLSRRLGEYYRKETGQEEPKYEENNTDKGGDENASAPLKPGFSTKSGFQFNPADFLTVEGMPDTGIGMGPMPTIGRDGPAGISREELAEILGPRISMELWSAEDDFKMWLHAATFSDGYVYFGNQLANIDEAPFRGEFDM